MGAMKSVRTAHVIGTMPARSDERETYNWIIGREKLRRSFAVQKQDYQQEQTTDKDALHTVFLRTGYVGACPSREGNYIVLETQTGGIQLVALGMNAKGQLLVRATNVPLSHFNQPTYRWFRLAPLTHDDEVELRTLPTATTA